MSRNNIIFSLIIFFVSSVIYGVYGQTRQAGTVVGFYSRTCPTVESVVQSAVASAFRTNQAVAPGLLRMHFHDCFVQGCDGSVLISGTGTERTAGANLGLRGFEVIDDAKTRLEAVCPGVVSCADILALAARDSVVLTGGRRWAVPTGRRDGRVSLAGNVNNLPGPRDSVAVQIRKFGDFRLNPQDLVALLGGHTIGTTACQFFRHRLFSFTPAGGPDPSINSTFLTQLQNLCPQNGDASVRVGLDATPNAFDSSYYQNLRTGRGILESDQLLWSDPTTGAILQRFLSGSLDFGAEFAKSMVKMSNIGVKTGSNGEIRRVCSAVN